ncbi:nucleoside triphosphate pyrophosphohydrolase [Azospirillaceae bacterium]
MTSSTTSLAPSSKRIERSTSAIDHLLEIMARLRHPQKGCPWDIEQTFETIAPHTIEEAYEVADAITQNNMDGLCDELGDLLFQVVFHSQMAHEGGFFSFDDVVEAIIGKMIRRHPHIFGDAHVENSAMQLQRWEEHKAAERAVRAATEQRPESALDGVTRGLPALSRALKLQKRAARVGFDWTNTIDILDKIEEEIQELRVELADGKRIDLAEEELGDVLFCLVNLARRLDLDPEAALRQTNDKFERRFHHIEKKLAGAGKKPEEATLNEMESLWQEAKTSTLK